MGDHEDRTVDRGAQRDPDWRWVGAAPDDRSPGAAFRREVAAVARQVMAAHGEAAPALSEPPPGHFDLRTTTPWLVEETARVLRQRLAPVSSAGSARVLVAVARLGGAGAHRLRESLALEPSTFSSALGRLADRGLIVRRRAPTDRRSWILEVTPAGRREAERIVAVWRRTDNVLLHTLSPGERDELCRLLRRSLAALVADEDS